MVRMRFRLSTLLMLLTFLAFIFGTGYQIILLRQQVATLNSEVTKLEQSSTSSIPVYYRPPAQSKNNTPFRLLNNQMVTPAIEEGMKAGEWEQQQRMEHMEHRDEIRSPKMPSSPEMQIQKLNGRLR
jgi:hypothetical protein